MNNFKNLVSAAAVLGGLWMLGTGLVGAESAPVIDTIKNVGLSVAFGLSGWWSMSKK